MPAKWHPSTNPSTTNLYYYLDINNDPHGQAWTGSSFDWEQVEGKNVYRTQREATVAGMKAKKRKGLVRGHVFKRRKKWPKWPKEGV